MVGGRNCLAYTKLKTPFPKVVYQDGHVLTYALSFPLSLIINNSLYGICTKIWVFNMAKLAQYFPSIKRKIKRTYQTIDQYLFYRLFLRYSKRLFIKMCILFLEKNKVVFASQYGFRKNRSTVNAITLLVCHITNAIENKQNTLSVFLDLSNAFDTIEYRP